MDAVVREGVRLRFGELVLAEMLRDRVGGGSW
jgi:hypothetical protein